MYAARGHGMSKSVVSAPRAVGLLLSTVAWAAWGCHRPHSVPSSPVPPSAIEHEVSATEPGDELARQAAEDPLAFLNLCRERYLATIRDYRCIFHIRERQADSAELGPEQEIAIRFREQPFSVDMRWTKNPQQATRVNYVAGRWQRGARDLALIYPSGLAGLLTPAGVRLDIHAPEVRAASRRPVDDFGFRRTMELIIENCQKARGDSAYDLRYIGEGEIDSRPCLVLRRLLPYQGPQGPFPDRLLLIYVDREWLVPTGCFSFTDDAGEQPLGTYVTTDVKINVGLTDQDF